jgi:hypothetical protein
MNQSYSLCLLASTVKKVNMIDPNFPFQYERENYAQMEPKGPVTTAPVTSVDSALDSWDSQGVDSQTSRPRLRLSVSSKYWHDLCGNFSSEMFFHLFEGSPVLYRGSVRNWTPTRTRTSCVL